MKILILEILSFHRKVLEIHFENVAFDSSKIFLQLKLSRSVSIKRQCISEFEGLEKLSKLSFNYLK